MSGIKGTSSQINPGFRRQTTLHAWIKAKVRALKNLENNSSTTAEKFTENLFMLSLNKHLLSTYYVLESVLGVWEIYMKQ